MIKWRPTWRIMNSKWQKVYTTQQSYLAEIIKGLLEEHDFQPIIINKTISGYLLGDYEIYINREDNILKAIKIINEHIK